MVPYLESRRAASLKLVQEDHPFEEPTYLVFVNANRME
jgi:hypothetical protein